MTFELSDGEHLAASLAVAAMVWGWWRRPEGHGERSLLWAAAVAALPIALMALPSGLSTFLVGKEGLAEAATEGLLVGLAARAIVVRQPWIAVGAVALFLEEVDYLQWFTGSETPGWLEEAGSNSTRMNTHNLPGAEVAWRLGPLTAVALLSAHAWWPDSLRAFADRARLPLLHGGVLRAVGVLLVLALLTAVIEGEDSADECGELGAVLLVLLGWRSGPSIEVRDG